MKTIKRYFNALLAIAILTTTSSCLVDDESLTDAFDDGPNFVSFSRFSQNLSAVSDGNTYDFNINVELQGPTLHEMTSDVSLTISVDPSSTAIEGVHYQFGSMTTTLTNSNNYLGAIPITVITQGIMAPLDVNPVLVLNISDSSGNNVISSSKQNAVTIVYQCFADLSGTYIGTNDFCSPSFTTTISLNPDGSWHIGQGDGGFLDICTGNAGLLNYAEITELCGEILPTTNLEYGTDGGFGIGDILGGTWDAATGTLTMQHQDVFFNGGPYQWTSTYVRQ